MQKLIFILLLCSTYTFSTFAQNTPFIKALTEKRIQVKVSGLGGYSGESLKLTIKNTDRELLNIEVPAGLRFSSEDQDIQDLIVAKTIHTNIDPGRAEEVFLSTFCTQSQNAAPYKDAVFKVDKMAEGGLRVLMDTIDAYNYHTSSSAQSAVWAMVNRRGASYVYGEDPEMIERLCTVLSQNGQPCDASNFQLRPHSLQSIKGSWEILSDTTITNVSLTAYDSTDQPVETYFTSETIPKGFYQYTYGLYHTQPESAEFTLKLEKDGKTILSKTITPNDTITALKELPEETFLTFTVKESARANIGVYDSLGHLYAMVKEDHLIRPGMHKIYLGEGIELPLNKQFFARITKGEKVLAEQAFFADALTRETFPTQTKRGFIHVALKDPLNQARLVIVDQYETEIWEVFANSNLGHGTRDIPFVFQHQRGSKGRFTARLYDKAGFMVAEQSIR